MSDLSAPPRSIVWQVERLVPGFYGAFVTRVLSADFPPGVSLSSWWRSIDRNRRARGAPESQHLWAGAADIDAPDLGALGRALDRTGLVVVRFPSYVHVQAWPAGHARRSGFLDALRLV